MVTVIEVLAVVAVLFVAAAVATRDGDVLVDVPPDAPDLGLPQGALEPEDVAELRFGLALRGYRMSEVDMVLSRLSAELAARDTRIRLLEQAIVDLVEPVVVETEPAPSPDPIPIPDPDPVPMPDPDPFPMPDPDPFPMPDPAPPMPDPGPIPAPLPTPLPAPLPAPLPIPQPDPAPTTEPAPDPLVPPPFTEPLTVPRASYPGTAVDDGAFGDFPEVPAPDAAPDGLPDATDEASDADAHLPLGVPGHGTASPYDGPTGGRSAGV